ncbi:hypothetical protein ABZP36_035445 [Zizania latifolia]
MHGKVLNGRTLSASIAEDNGRASEFIRRRVYRDKSRCYERGEEGHLSYEGPRNQLGPRERPPPSKKSRRGGGGGGGGGRGASWQSDDEDGATAFEDDRWASVVDTRGVEEKASGKDDGKATSLLQYFSDELTRMTTEFQFKRSCVMTFSASSLLELSDVHTHNTDNWGKYNVFSV